tara:strand:- start:827 stop:1234 length:408 start_codon:yes stop_codon:yes gene_type:complete
MLLRVHIIATSAWLGLIAAETVMELMAKDKSTRLFVAKVHKIIDIYFEGPLVAIVLFTGSILLYQLWPNASFLLLAKVTAGLTAVLSNILCIDWVIRRAQAKNESEFSKYARRISWTGYIVPLGFLALAIGLYGV